MRVLIVLCSLSHVQISVTLMDYPHGAYQAPLPMEFSRQEYWSGLPFPTPRDLPNPDHRQADSLPLVSPILLMLYSIMLL